MATCVGPVMATVAFPHDTSVSHPEQLPAASRSTARHVPYPPTSPARLIQGQPCIDAIPRAARRRTSAGIRPSAIPGGPHDLRFAPMVQERLGASSAAGSRRAPSRLTRQSAWHGGPFWPRPQCGLAPACFGGVRQVGREDGCPLGASVDVPGTLLPVRYRRRPPVQGRAGGVPVGYDVAGVEVMNWLKR